VACPGRLLDHVQRGNADLSCVQTLVLDEADRMLDMGFLADVRRIVAQTPRERQTMLFSATFAPELDRFAREILRDPERIEIGLTAPAQTVRHALCPVAPDRKTEMLLALLGSTDVRLGADLHAHQAPRQPAGEADRPVGAWGGRTALEPLAEPAP
jgi:ATP-dependent RNA helicase RhlE